MKRTRKLLFCVLVSSMLMTLCGSFSGAMNAIAAEPDPYDETQETEKKQILTGWVQDNGRIYYYNTAGKKVVGKKKIKGKVYYFSKKKATKGALMIGLVTISGKEYYFKPSGKIGTVGSGANGWVSIPSRGYCYCVNGKIQKKDIIDDYYLKSNGAMKSKSKKLYKLVKSTVKRLTNNAMSQEEKLRACYNYLCSSTFTYITKRPFSYASTWRVDYGYEMFTTYSGVCYNFSSALAYMARYIGYTDVKAIAGSLLYLDGHWDLHSWTKIFIDGRYYLFDASMEHGGMGNFWKKTISGTSLNYTEQDGRKYREWTYLN